LGQGVALAVDADRAFGHGFEKRALRFRTRTIDFVGEKKVREDRSFAEFKLRASRLEPQDSHDIAGKKVARHLHPTELAAKGVGQGFGERGLAGARRTFEKEMSAGDKARERIIHGRAQAFESAIELIANRFDERQECQLVGRCLEW